MKAAVAGLVGPQRDRAADDLIGGDQPKIPAVETVADVPIHQEDFADMDAPAALPDRKIAADPVAVERDTGNHAVDDDDVADPANSLTGDGAHALEKRHALRQIVALVEKGGERFGRIDGDKISHLERAGEVDRVEADRRAGRCVPDQFDRHRREAGIADANGCERGGDKKAGARHGVILRRWSHAACRSVV